MGLNFEWEIKDCVYQPWNYIASPISMFCRHPRSLWFCFAMFMLCYVDRLLCLRCVAIIALLGIVLLCSVLLCIVLLCLCFVIFMFVMYMFEYVYVLLPLCFALFMFLCLLFIMFIFVMTFPMTGKGIKNILYANIISIT